MLILTRRISQTLIIGNIIEITVLNVRGNQVRLGIKAPKEIPVHRLEIYERIKKEHAIKPEPDFGGPDYHCMDDDLGEAI